MENEKFEVKGKEVIYKNRRWSIEATKVGTIDGDQNWEQLRSHSPAVVVIPVNSEGKIGIISQNRVLEDGTCQIVYEFPSGWMESTSLEVSNEEMEENANRELGEEIGYKAGKLELLSNFRLSNFTLVPFYVMLATDLEENQLPRDEGESIEVEWVSLDEAEKRLIQDQTPTAQVFIALHAYKDQIAKQK